MCKAGKMMVCINTYFSLNLKMFYGLKLYSQGYLRKCAVGGCIEPSETSYSLPKDPLIRDQWLQFLEKEPNNNPNNKYIRVCKKHFSDSDFTRSKYISS